MLTDDELVDKAVKSIEANYYLSLLSKQGIIAAIVGAIVFLAGCFGLSLAGATQGWQGQKAKDAEKEITAILERVQGHAKMIDEFAAKAKTPSKGKYFRTGRLTFPSRIKTGPQIDDKTVTFDSPITDAVVVLQNFEIGFTPRHDASLGRASISLRAEIQPDKKSVKVHGDFLVRDWSDELDDAYEGWADFVIFAYE